MWRGWVKRAVRRYGCESEWYQALVDTGSPVSLIRKSVYVRFCGNDKLLAVKENLRLKGVNDTKISVRGKVYEQITLDKLPEHWFDIALLVVNDHTMAYDVLLGR